MKKFFSSIAVVIVAIVLCLAIILAFLYLKHPNAENPLSDDFVHSVFQDS